MSEPQPYFSESRDPGQGIPLEQRRERRAVGGGLLGFVLAAVLFWGVGPALPSATGAAGLVATVLLPLLAAVVVLAVPRWRRAGAGLIMGMAIGAIIFAGSCAALYAAIIASFDNG